MLCAIGMRGVLTWLVHAIKRLSSPQPTNDLDVDTLRCLEEAVNAFAGSVIVISHDRWRVNMLVLNCTPLPLTPSTLNIMQVSGPHLHARARVRGRQLRPLVRRELQRIRGRPQEAHGHS